MRQWRWIGPATAHAIHDRQLAEHGGLEGIRDLGAIESALGRPMQFAEYDTPDVFALAACYLWGLVRNHGYADGNKRTAWVIARVFLADHGVRISFDKLEAVHMVQRAAAGELPQHAIATWFRTRAVTAVT